MREKRAKFEPEIERIVVAIDPASSVPASIQLRGALEFGIASGELGAGQRLPSVRALAKRVGGGGGGRPTLATAGGKQPEKLPEALGAAAETLRAML